MKLKTNALIVLAGLSLGVVAQAQPGQGGQGMGRGRGQGQGGRGQQMTPQQMQLMREEMMKTQMTEFGIDAAAQTAIIAYAGARETAANPLRAQGRTLQQGLANNVSAEVAARQLVALRTAIAAEKARRATAEGELDKAVGFSKNPILEAYLTLGGLIGDEGTFLAPPAGGGRGGRGGRGQGGRGPGGGGPGGDAPPEA